MPGITIQTPQQTDTAAIAEAAFVSVPSFLPESSYVCVGDTIDTDQQEGFLRCTIRLICLNFSLHMGLLGGSQQEVLYRGHGTQVVDGSLMATVCGVIQRVNKLISVVPVKARCANFSMMHCSVSLRVLLGNLPITISMILQVQP